MHRGQEQFLTYLLARTREDRREEAKRLLLEAFECQEKQCFSKEDLDALNKKLLSLLQPRYQEEVAAILHQFGDQHISH